MGRATSIALLAAALLPRLLAAQTDYRNLDHGRPLQVEDAYPVEHHSLEFELGYGLERENDLTSHQLTPELTWGIVTNLQVGLEFPLTSLGGSGGDGLAGINGSALYNLTTESRWLPGLAVGGAVNLPVGALARDRATGEALLAATRSFGRWRGHFNAGLGLGRDRDRDWSVTGALDRTLYRQSLLLLAALRYEKQDQTSNRTIGELGLRWQATANLVLDAGITRRLNHAGPDLGLTFGVSRSIGLPRGRKQSTVVSHTERPGLSQRGEERYAPGSFNWRFLSTYPEAARLFNAFDYGHAVLYQRLLTGQGRKLEQDFRYLTADLLVRPPRLAVAEETIAPDYARFAWRAMQIFDWAHTLHRQIYDILADERISPDSKSEEIERITDIYLANRRLALAALPKQMDLMDGQYFSQEFRHAYPRFNALIWSYHWLQVGLYEPLLVESTRAGRKAGVQAALAKFQRMVQDLELNGPSVMPMTPAIAPEFTRQHPRAAAIFDNLHMLHDIVSDILYSEKVTRDKKAGEIYQMLDRFQDSSQEVMPAEHWLMMGDMMGGVDRMGGSVRPQN